jgi:hypothetical protein
MGEGGGSASIQKFYIFECLLGVPSFGCLPQPYGLRVFSIRGCIFLLNLSSLRWISKRREEENEEI